MSTKHKGPVGYGIKRLESALDSRGVEWTLDGDTYDCGKKGRITVGGCGNTETRWLLEKDSVTPPSVPESLCVHRIRCGDAAGTLVLYGADDRGMMYALLEAARAIELAPSGDDLFALVDEENGGPELKQRSMARFFSSEVLDKSWWYSMDFWHTYFGMLARNRYNRFTFTLGGAYDFPVDIKDSYFYFPFPFLVDLPEYSVRAIGLPTTERVRNLDTLKAVSAMAKEYGIDFYLGMWTINGVFAGSPEINYPIEGVTPENNAAYAGAAMQELLTECRDLVGVSLRINFESGIREDDAGTWNTFFEGIRQGNPDIKLDLRAKGIHKGLVKIVRDMGLDLTVSTKFTAEHMGLPYHQAQIRITELTDVGTHPGLDISRRFIRYGYGDMLISPRDYKFMFRLWALGTQKVLLWGDPDYVATLARNCKIGLSEGLEVSEPLTYRGMRASVKPNPSNRGLFVRTGMDQYQWAFQRYWQYFLYFGHLTYNTKANPLKWQREFVDRFGERSASHLEKALQYASKTLPLVTMAYMPSASNRDYWPEIYTPMPIIGDPDIHYTDSPEPKRAGTVEPLDTAMFYTIDQYVSDLLQGERDGRYGPREVSEWLLNSASITFQCIEVAEETIDNHNSPEFLGLKVDVKVQAYLARFFAYKFLATMHYGFFRETDDYASLHCAVKTYEQALNEWRTIVALTHDTYQADLAFGDDRWARGTWADRESLLAKDLRAMEEIRRDFLSNNANLPSITILQSGIQNPNQVCIEATVKGWQQVVNVELHYRVEESTAWERVLMEQDHTRPPVYVAKLSVSQLSRQFRYFVAATYRGGKSITSPENGGLAPLVLQLRSETVPPVVVHTPPVAFKPGVPITIKAGVRSKEILRSIRLHYRHVNQAEFVQVVDMQTKDDRYEATIPGSYTDSPYEMMYYFEVIDEAGNALLHPGLQQDWSDLPYIVLPRDS